ncbi:MAG: tRNA (N6-isopentenyl adenosine(37)-C2)-methylthiotransferase MiaB [Myxococcota bacterium]
MTQSMNPPRRFHLRTYGCQMNVHDSEKVANLLTHAGYRASDDADEADVLIVNTCSIREKAEHRLYTDLGRLRAWKEERAGRILGIAGCVAQQEGDSLLRRFRQIDFVYGTHNLRWVPELVAAAETGGRRAATEEDRSPDRFALPERHPDLAPTTPGRSFVTVMEGCDMFCTFCVVPNTRGREISRPAEAIASEVRVLVDQGVREVTLLGQTVNAYGRHDVRRGKAPQAGTESFTHLLERLSSIPGLERIRYTSPHPRFFDDDLIRAHATLPNLCPHVHLPLQSGSDAVLERMRRRYTADEYRAIVRDLRATRSDLVLTTDLIVGFPGETDADFEATLAVVEESAFVDAFSFKYSPRPETAAATLSDPVPPEVAQERLERLQSLQRGLTLAAHRARVGTETEVLVEGTSRRGGQWTGHDPYHRVVNLAVPADLELAPGDRLPVAVVEATPHSLIGEPCGPPRRFEGRMGLVPNPQCADEPRQSARV